MYRKRRIRRKQPGIDQGTYEEHETARVAAGVRYAAGGADAPAPSRFQLRQPVGPAARHPVGGARIHDAGPARRGPCRRLARRIVRQAEHRDVRFLHPLAARRRILAKRLGETEEFDVVAPTEPVANAKPGGTHVAIDIDLGPVGRHLPHLLATCAPRLALRVLLFAPCAPVPALGPARAPGRARSRRPERGRSRSRSRSRGSGTGTRGKRRL